MSISFGGLGLMSLRNPFAELVGLILGKSDLRSMFCLVVFCIVVLVLAYLTNPSENSFRAYLTEQSFRQHLSRLDDNTDDDHGSQDNSPYSSKRGGLATAHTLSFDNSSPFHFANRASVSLRTPKHVFHNFGIFTIAAMVPLARSARSDERDGLMISDPWYVGVFGRWWRVYQDVVARSKDAESWSSGILSMKNLDMLHDYNGLPFSTRSLPPHLLSRSSPPKVRNRERPSHRSGILPSRSSTPPPLPKSASLPLHIARLPSSSVDLSPSHSVQPLQRAPSQSCTNADEVQLGSPLPSRSSCTLFDQSPRIAEVLRQISHSKATVFDLRTQLTDCQACASQPHAQLQGEVDSFRERKRQEDASKLELKSRTKALDDSRRSAESMKKDTEKKLKVAQNARDSATQRMDYLDKEIAKLHQCLADDRTLMRRAIEAVSDAEQEITDALEHKKHEIKAAEDVVAALSRRARELEEKLSEEKDRLNRLKERSESRKQDQSPHPGQAPNQLGPSHIWSPFSFDLPYDPTNNPSIFANLVAERKRSLTGFKTNLDRRSSLPRDSQTSSRPDSLALGSISNFNPSPSTVYTTSSATPATLYTNGYSVFDDSLTSTAQQHRPSSFSPFGDSDASQLNSMVSPTSQSLIPSALITPIDHAVDGTSRSFQSESDVYMDREWRGGNINPYSHHQFRAEDTQSSGVNTVTTSPVSLRGPSANDFERDYFEARPIPSTGDYGREQPYRLPSESSMDMQGTSWLHRTNSDPSRNHYTSEEGEQLNSIALERVGGRRWFSTTSKDKPKKGLNPDAKVFSLSMRSPPKVLAVNPSFDNDTANPTPTYDALNPNGLGSKAIPPTTSTNNSLLRAFAPSPAEREALQRALGGSTNASFELLPSLSDVGSIPSSPAHVDAHPTGVSHVPQRSAREMGKALPSWLQSLPRIRKANFSPWDDEEPASIDVNGGAGASGARRR